MSDSARKREKIVSLSQTEMMFVIAAVALVLFLLADTQRRTAQTSESKISEELTALRETAARDDAPPEEDMLAEVAEILTAEGALAAGENSPQRLRREIPDAVRELARQKNESAAAQKEIDAALSATDTADIADAADMWRTRRTPIRARNAFAACCKTPRAARRRRTLSESETRRRRRLRRKLKTCAAPSRAKTRGVILSTTNCDSVFCRAGLGEARKSRRITSRSMSSIGRGDTKSSRIRICARKRLSSNRLWRAISRFCRVLRPAGSAKTNSNDSGGARKGKKTFNTRTIRNAD